MMKIDEMSSLSLKFKNYRQIEPENILTYSKLFSLLLSYRDRQTEIDFINVSNYLLTHIFHASYIFDRLSIFFEQNF